MFLPRNCSTKSSIFAPPGVKLEFGIKWSRSHPHFCASENHTKKRELHSARGPWNPSVLRVHIFRARFWAPAFVAPPQNRELHILRARPLESIRFASSISPTRVFGHPAFLATLQIHEPHIFRARPLESISLASPISHTRVLWCLSFLATLQNRGFVMFRARPPEPLSLASSISSTRVFGHPAFLATPQNCGFDMFRAAPPAQRRKTGGFYGDRTEMRVRYVPRTARETQQKMG